MFYGVYDIGILDATIFLSDTSYVRWSQKHCYTLLQNEQVVKCKLHRKELRERPRQEMEKLTMGKAKSSLIS